jgi:polysaccharide biosynthesis transport protein
MSDQQSPEDIPNQSRPGEDLPLPGPQDRQSQNGDGALSHAASSAARADAYGGGYGFLGAKNRFQETSALFARLHRYELALRKHWWILVLALCGSVGAAACYLGKTTSSYQSTARLWVSGKLDLREGQLYSEEFTSFMGTQVELLKSATLFDRAFTNMLTAHPGWASLFTNYTSAERRPFKVTVADFPKTAVIEVNVVGKQADAVREFADSLMEEYQNFRKGVRQQKTDVTLSSITEQVRQLETEVKRQQERLQSFLGSNNVVLLQEQGSSAGAYAAQLSKQLASLRTEFKLLELIAPEQLTQIGKSRVSPEEDATVGQGAADELTTTLAGPLADFFRASQQIQLYRAKREELLEFLQPSHPKILKLDESIAEQQEIVEVFKRQSLAQMAHRREALALQIGILETSVAEWEQKALEASRKMADYDRIRQDVQRTQSLYEKLLGVIQQVDVNHTLDQETVLVMDAASKPKTVRRAPIILGLGVAGGLFFGLGLLYVVSLFDDRFASLTELGSQLPETVIGQIPNARTLRRQPGLELVRADDDRHAFAESFRNIRSWILFSSEKSKQPRLILVTSALPLEGKSTVASNLAHTLALAGSRVLLIDGDLRRAGLDEIFDAPNDLGFADVLDQRASSHDLIHPTKTPNLWLLPAGSPNTNPGQLFLAPTCDIFLAQLRPQFDYVIFDSAPVLAADDTTNLAPKISAVLFVVRADYTSARHASEALLQLRQRKATILGLVFNRSKATYSDGYYYRYKNYHSDGPNGRKRKRGKKTSSSRGTVAAAADIKPDILPRRPE